MKEAWNVYNSSTYLNIRKPRYLRERDTMSTSMRPVVNTFNITSPQATYGLRWQPYLRFGRLSLLESTTTVSSTRHDSSRMAR
jgi:hypothetical protein